jgi:hypothetical protein
VSDIFQEVQEEYRREQMAKLWEKYRVPVVAAVGAIVVAVAGYQGWSFWRAAQVEKASREFEAIAELSANPGNEKAAADRFANLAATGTSAYALAAKFQEAGLRAEMGDGKAAIALYDSISASTSDPVFRDYAQVRAGLLIVERESFDNIKKRLEPIATGAGPWRLQALELLAYASWRAGKSDEALKLYGEIEGATNVPNGTARRAKEMTSLIKAGMKLSDVNAMLAPAATPGSGPMLLQPTQPTTPTPPAIPEPSSLLGPAAEQPPTP